MAVAKLLPYHFLVLNFSEKEEKFVHFLMSQSESYVFVSNESDIALLEADLTYSHGETPRESVSSDMDLEPYEAVIVKVKQ